jgi:hypothetical protein
MKLLPPPGPERRSQLIRLAVLTVIVAGLGWYQFGRTPVPATPSPAASDQSGRPGTSGAPLPVPEALRLAMLDPLPEPPEAGRNPFRFGEKPKPPAPPPPPPMEHRPPPPPPPPPPPQVKLEVVIIMTVSPTQIRATMKDPATGTLFYDLVEGTEFDGRYRVVKLTQSSIVVEFLDGTGRRTFSAR